MQRVQWWWQTIDRCNHHAAALGSSHDPAPGTLPWTLCWATLNQP